MSKYEPLWNYVKENKKGIMMRKPNIVYAGVFGGVL